MHRRLVCCLVGALLGTALSSLVPENLGLSTVAGLGIGALGGLALGFLGGTVIDAFSVKSERLPLGESD